MPDAPDPNDRILTIADPIAFDDARVSLPALGLYCWMAWARRTFREARARFDLTDAELDALLDELRRAGLVQDRGAGS